MEAGPLVFLIITFVAIAVVAAFLITVVYQLSQVWSRLNTILGVVGQVIEKTAVLDPILSEISTNLEAGNGAITSAVERLKLRKGVGDAGADSQNREPAGIGASTPLDPPPNVYTNY